MVTMPLSRLQFAVVREDPRIEEAIARQTRPRRALLVGSGGCTALHLRACLPSLDVTLVEPNPAQLEHVQAKLDALARFEPTQFNVGNAAADGLHECGNFERLFRLLRTVLDLFVLPPDERRRRCADPGAGWDDVMRHPYWPVAFAIAFADDLLQTMFGPAAVQHAPRGSYPGYFQRRIEAGLVADDRARNPWLHHVLLGHYLDEQQAWPPFLRRRPADLAAFPCLPTTLIEVGSFTPFDFVHLSNVLDWMDDGQCQALAKRLADELRPGATILWRQLNDPRPLIGHFAPTFVFDAAHDARLLHAERSLFYDQVHLGRHR